LIKKYTDDLLPREITNTDRSTKHSIILTGSTGSLGSYILSELLDGQDISKVYCIKRGEDAKEKQIRSFEQKALAINPDFHDRVEFLHAQFGAVNFGLSVSKYNELKAAVHLIVHNAWKMNFNRRVKAFDASHIRASVVWWTSASKASIWHISILSPRFPL
jgi:nucleoside-diphosphate-sugar epimerase